MSAIELLDGIAVRQQDLLSPNSFFVRVFQKNSNRELHSSFLQSNQYSWYSPANELLRPLRAFFETSFELSYQNISSQIDFYQGSSIELSHKNFGLFINSLSIFDALIS